jgi:RNA polymerase sigma-70 factor (ECF subfamily)
MTLQTRIDASVRASPQFEAEFVALIPHLRAFSRMLCGRRGIADDMTQEALAKGWRARDSYEPGTNLKAWLFTILRNEFYSQVRRGWREASWDAEKGDLIATPANEQQWAAELSDTARAMRGLPHDQREALILVGAGGFTYEEAGMICQSPANTIKSRVSRARAALQRTLDGALPIPVRAKTLMAGACNDILAQLSAIARPMHYGATVLA